MTFTDEPLEDARNYEDYLQGLSVECDCCHEDITGDYYDIHGNIICVDCIEQYLVER